MKNEIIFTPFYLSFLALCKRDKLTPTEAAKRAGISSGAPTAWKKKGAIPRPEQLKKLCALFNVSEQEMLGYSAQKEKPTSVPGDGRSNAERLFMPLVDKLTPEQQQLLLVQLQAWTGQDVPLAPAGPDSNREKGVESDL